MNNLVRRRFQVLSDHKYELLFESISNMHWQPVVYHLKPTGVNVVDMLLNDVNRGFSHNFVTGYLQVCVV